MRNVIIVLWVTLIGFFAVPIAVSYMAAVPQEEVEAVIQRESEADDIRVTSEEIHGNKAMYSFSTKKDFGVAVFDHFGGKYSYSEGTMGNGEKDVKVRLDTGWDVYKYRVTKEGTELVEIEKSAGNYKIYAVIGVALAAVTVISVFYGAVMRRKNRPDKYKEVRR